MWDYEREEGFGKIPAGRHRVRIEAVDEQVSKKGNDMIRLTLSVSGQYRTIWDYIVFMEDHPEMTNRKFTQIYDSFGIKEGSFDYSEWVGKVGAAVTKIDENDYEKISYYLKPEKAEDLPPWAEPSSKSEAVRSSSDDYTMDYDLDVPPF